MASINKVILVGNLGKDPELRYTNGGTAVTNFSLATSENFTDRSGQKQERTEWHRIVAWGKTAEFCGEYLTKGRKIYLEGKIQTREWTDKEGVKKYSTEIVANDIQFLDSKGEGAPRGAARNGGAERSSNNGDSGAGSRGSSEPPPEDDIPF